LNGIQEDEDQKSIPWNNYVIGLLSIESPNTFTQFDDSTSPQYLALQWISVDSSRKGASTAYTMDSSLQRYALATLYFALGGEGSNNGGPSPSWTNDDAWLSTVVNECDWYGVTCDPSGTAVISLDLSGNGLSGTLPPELALFKYLKKLTLPENSISGTLPPEYSDLRELFELNLAGNDIEGSVPWEYGGEYGSFELLTILDFSRNKLEGSIPSEIGNMLNLEIVNLCSNKLTGTIPASVGNLFYIRSLKLGNNQLNGEVPSSICDLGSLNSLALSSGSENGPLIPDVIVDCTIDCDCCDHCCGSGGDVNEDVDECCAR